MTSQNRFGRTIPGSENPRNTACKLIGQPFGGKLFLEAWASWRHRRAERFARLLRLSSLLSASRAAFEIQIEKAKCQTSMLVKNHPESLPDETGYERSFTTLYKNFTSDEADLHAIIRGITINALRPVNESMTKWLDEDIYFRTQLSSGKRGELAVGLNLLASHLFLWHASTRYGFQIILNTH
jgi:hypothetical protein